MESVSLNELSVLVTGGAGFIGSHIVEYLLKNGVKFVRILDNLSTGFMSNIKNLLDRYDNVEFMWGDITNIELCRKACVGISVICHQAALGSVPRSINDPLSSHNVNVNGFLNILIAAKENNIKRIVYASSSSVYGSNTSSVKYEDDIGEQLSPYAVTKHIDELYGKVFAKTYGLECIGLRYFNVFGPRQNPTGMYAAVIPKFILAIINDTRPIINGDGTFSRNFTFVDNVVSANILALTTQNNKCFGQVFNVGTNSSVSINDLVDAIKNILGKYNIQPRYAPIRSGDISNSNASVNKIAAYLGYGVKINFYEGLQKTIEYFSGSDN